MIVLALIAGGSLVMEKLDGWGEQRFPGRFRVVDGDTIARADTRFRLIGIDAPELRQTCFRGDAEWRCGEQARDHLRNLVQSTFIECRGNSRDKYNRLLVRCTAEGQDVGASMVAAGMAVATEYFLFSAEQAEARARKAGIWSSDFQQPGEWRRNHRAADMDTPFAGMFKLLRRLIGW